MATTKSKRGASPNIERNDHTRGWETYGAVLILIAATVATYGHVVREDFVHWDDIVHVFENPHFAHINASNLAFFWTHPYQHLYIPVSYMAFALIAWLSRMPHIDHKITSVETFFNPHYFHTANLVLHTLNAIMVFAILLRLIGMTASPTGGGRRGTGNVWASLVGALLFSLHPLQVESVAWISELRGLLAGFFCLAATYAYLLAVGVPTPPTNGSAGQESPHRRPSYWIALALTIFAMLAKPSAVSLPLVLFALDRWIVGRPLRACILSTAPWLAISLTFVVITHFVQEVSPADTSPVWQRPFIAGDALAFYLGKLVVPINLTIDYGRKPAYVMSHSWGYLTWLVPAAIAAVSYALRRRQPWLVAAGLISIAYLLPVLGLIPFAFQVFSTVSDRYAYLAMLGPALIATMIVANLGEGRRLAAYVASACVLAVFAATTVQQVRRWNDSVSLFRWAVRINPNSYGVHENFGVSLDESATLVPDNAPDAAGRRRAIYTEAIRQYTETAALKPDDATDYNDRGVAEMALGNLSDAQTREADMNTAIADYRQAIALDPTIYLAHRGLGVALMQEDQMTEALEEDAEAVRLAPNDSRTHTIYALALYKTGSDDDAIREYRTAIDLQPGLYEAMAGLGDILANQAGSLKTQGNMEASDAEYAQAVAEYRQAVQLNPGDYSLHFSLAHTLFDSGQAAAAIPELQATVRLKPLPLYYDRLGIAYAVTGDFASAKQAFVAEQQLDPTSAAAAKHLAMLTHQQQALPPR